MSEEGETPEPVETFLERAERLFVEYDDGYVDPDVAVERLGDYVSDLRDAYEE